MKGLESFATGWTEASGTGRSTDSVIGKAKHGRREGYGCGKRSVDSQRAGRSESMETAETGWTGVEEERGEGFGCSEGRKKIVGDKNRVLECIKRDKYLWERCISIVERIGK